VNLIHWLSKIIFPPLQECSLCHGKIAEEIDIGLCPKCQAQLQFLPEGPGPNAKNEHRALFAYEGQGKELVLNYKYRFQPSLAGVFADLWLEQGMHLYPWQSEPIITYVPMTLRREKERGFHSSLCLAEALSKRSKIPMVHALVKRKQPPEQHHLNKEERWQTLDGVYGLKKSADLANREVLLIDDVYTTGATLHYCAEALKAAGVKSIYALTVAKTL
jgi:competence protein ComFC